MWLSRRFPEVGEGDALPNLAHKDARLAFAHRVHGRKAQSGGQQPVKERGRAAPLEITGHRDTYGQVGCAGQCFCQSVSRHGPARNSQFMCGYRVSLGDDDDGEILPLFLPLLEVCCQRLYGYRLLGDGYEIGPPCEAAVQCQPARLTAHDLHDHDPVMRRRRRMELVQRIADRRNRAVESYAEVGAKDVIVDAIGHDDTRNVVCIKYCRHSDGTAVADDDTGRDAVAFQDVAYLPQVLDRKLGRHPRTAEDASTQRKDTRNCLLVHDLDVATYESFEPVPYHQDIVSELKRAPCNGANGCVHTWCVRPCRHDCDTSHLCSSLCFSATGSYR